MFEKLTKNVFEALYCTFLRILEQCSRRGASERARAGKVQKLRMGFRQNDEVLAQLQKWMAVEHTMFLFAFKK